MMLRYDERFMLPKICNEMYTSVGPGVTIPGHFYI